MDLFTPVVPPSAFHPNFERVLRVATAEERRVLTDWATGFSDRDGKFVKEFQTTFNSSFWELYLFAAFKVLGLKVDLSPPSPDFFLHGSTGEFTAEAVTASNPDGHRPEWDVDLSSGAVSEIDLPELLHLASIRLANAIVTKHRKYQKTYARLAHVRGKPFVLCVAPFEQPHFFAQNDNAIRRVLYGYDRPLTIDGRNAGNPIVVGEARAPSVEKESGASVPLGLFTKPGFEDISAVIFSSTATYGKLHALRESNEVPVMFVAKRYQEISSVPAILTQWKTEYRETLLDGLHVCLNPYARHELDLRLFEGREIAVHRYFAGLDLYTADAPDGFLIERVCISARTGAGSKLPRTANRSAYKTSKRAPLPGGKLVEANAEIPPFVENHIAHYHGWTIVVAFDLVDRCWVSQALQGTYFTIPEFMRGMGEDDDRLHLIGSVDSSTEEEARAHAVAAIDGQSVP